MDSDSTFWRTVSINEELTDEVKSKLKKLCRKMTGEPLVIFNDADDHILIHKNKKIIGMCFIAKTSPGEYSGETPYLYNFICDAQYRKYQISKILMEAVEDYFAEDVEPCPQKLYLDVEISNVIAQRFFEKNKFVELRRHDIANKQFIRYVRDIEPSGYINIILDE